MATKTFEELKQLAIQIRDEKTNKQNTATRVGTAMLEHINKLEQDYYDKTQTDEELKERDDKLTELEEQPYASSSNSIDINGSIITILGDTLKIYINRGKTEYIIQHTFTEEENRTFDLSNSNGYILVYNKETNTIETCDRDTINNRIVLLYYALYERSFVCGALYNSVINTLNSYQFDGLI